MDTKEKIILAAAEEFSKLGYHGATTRHICERAEVNIAAVNYHFSTKEALYKHVIEYLFQKTGEVLSETVAVVSEAEWRQAIYDWIVYIITTTTDSASLNAWKHRILFREMLDPSDAFPEFFEKYFKPHFASLEYSIRCGLPDGVSRDEVYIVIFSILSQCLFYFQNKLIVKQLFSEGFLDEENRVERISRYISEGACSRLKYATNEKI